MQGTKQEAEDRKLLILIGTRSSVAYTLINKKFKSCFCSIASAAYRVGNVGIPPKINGVLQSMKASLLAGFCEAAAFAGDIISIKVFLDIFKQTSMDCPYFWSEFFF